MNTTSRVAGLFLIVARSLRQHALSTAVTVASLALGGGLVMAVFNVNAQTYRAFTGGTVGFDAVLGARGSHLQLVLNTVFHMETSPGNIPWSLYAKVKADPRVQLAVPYAVGDSYRGFRIVGTTTEMFTDFEYQEGRKFAMQPGGRVFDPGRREAVVGSIAAREAGLRVGSHLHPTHGTRESTEHDHDEEYVVVGVMEPTNSPSDRVLWIPIEGIFRMGGHVLRGSGEEFHAEAGEEIPDEHKEVSAVMLKFRDVSTGFRLDQEINRQGKEATLAWPIARSLTEFFQKLGWVNRVLELVAYLVVVVAAGSVLASLYNTMNERRREFAILRSLGARRQTVFTVIVLEAATIAGLAAVLAFVVYGTILLGAAWVVRREIGVVLELLSYHPALWLTPLGMILVGSLAGVLPALRAYRTDVASNLVPSS